MTLAASCRQMAQWTAAFGPAAPQTMCANVSSRQLTDALLLNTIAAALESNGLLAGQLKLEITESSLIGDLPAALLILKHARALGIGWSLDDFGTGYSSLSVLQRLQVDTVKVDRSFVSEMNGSGNGSEMVRVIVGLAHALGMDVVAEGVETAQQADELRALGCDYAQGFYFSRPVETTTAGGLIASQPWQAGRTQHAIQ
jgi:EAL domain-containing protein (putative c-di-GMP-specific phosphodiesterase class I)